MSTSSSNLSARTSKRSAQRNENDVAGRIVHELEQAEVLLQSASTMEGSNSSAPISCENSDIELTVVIPVYNEPVTVLEIVDRVRALSITKQIVVVNDGSTDSTAENLSLLNQFSDVTVLHHEINRGKGAALQTGFQHAKGRFVIVQDADLEYDPEDILRVIAPLQSGESQVVYGSRYLENARQDPSLLHRAGNWALTTLSNLLTGHRLTDMETCYKAFRSDVLRSIHIEQSRFGFEPEITAKLAKRRISIREVGISYNCRSHAEGKKIGIRDLWNALYCIARYSFSKAK